MTYTYVRPRALTWLVAAILVVQLAFLANALADMIGAPGRSSTVQAVNATNGVLLVTGMLIAPKYPRVTWALLALSLVGMVSTAILFRVR